MRKDALPANATPLDVEGNAPGKITHLLNGVQDGGKVTENALYEEVYEELRRIAARQLKRERRNRTLTATALVHEVYIRMAGKNGQIKNSDQFFAVYAKAMQRILIDKARERMALKRPSSRVRLSLDNAMLDSRADDFLELNEFLETLAKVDRKAKEVFFLRYFGGMTIKECVVELMNRSADGDVALTVKAMTEAGRIKELERDCNFAKAYLNRLLKKAR